MGFYEDDRIRNKNAQFQDDSVKHYSLVLDKEIDLNKIIGALKECGFNIELKKGTVKIMS